MFGIGTLNDTSSDFEALTPGLGPARDPRPPHPSRTTAPVVDALKSQLRGFTHILRVTVTHWGTPWNLKGQCNAVPLPVGCALFFIQVAFSELDLALLSMPWPSSCFPQCLPRAELLLLSCKKLDCDAKAA